MVFKNAALMGKDVVLAKVGRYELEELVVVSWSWSTGLIARYTAVAI
jgi:hypothetical protein